MESETVKVLNADSRPDGKTERARFVQGSGGEASTHDASSSALTDSETVWGIQDFAKRFDVTTRTVRFYEDKGLLSPKRLAGARIFGVHDQARFERILRAKRLGFTLDDIKEVLDVTDGRISDRAELLRRKGNFEKVIKSLKRRRKDVEILAQEMTELCADIDVFLAKAPETSDIFQYAKAYDARFRETMADDFSPDRN